MKKFIKEYDCMSPVSLTRTNKDSKIVSVSIMIMYAFWRFLLSTTTWATSGLLYIAFMLVPVLLCCTVLKFKRIKIPLSVMVCFPFVWYTFFQYISSFRFEQASYWLDCIFLVIIAANTIFPQTIREKWLIVSGFIVMIGIFFQILFPDFYYSNIASKFTSYEQIRYWGSAKNYAGFTYQLGQSAAILVMAEGATLYLCKKKLKPVWVFLITLLFIVSTILTGKRMLSMLSVVVPLIVYCFSGNSIGKVAKRLILFVIIISLGALVLIASIDYLASTNIGIFTRFSATLESLFSGESLDVTRDSLIQMALDAFKKHPVFGIGAGNFMSVTGSKTEVHNIYIQTLCELGIIGFIFLIAMLLYYILKTISLMRKSKSNKCYLQFSLFIQLVFILNSFTENGMINLSEYFLYFIAVGICIYADMEFKRVRYKRIEKAVTK